MYKKSQIVGDCIFSKTRAGLITLSSHQNDVPLLNKAEFFLTHL